MSEYFSIFLQIVVAIGFAAAALITSVLLGKSAKSNSTKDSAYECGIPTTRDAQPRFSVKFYLVAMLFILFDIEIVFMYPWAVVFKDYVLHFGPEILWSMFSFVVILLIGYLYAVKKGALDWSH